MSNKWRWLIVGLVMMVGCGGEGSAPDAIVGVWAMYAASETLEGSKVGIAGTGYSGGLRFYADKKFEANIKTPPNLPQTNPFAGTWRKSGTEYMVSYSGAFAGHEQTYGLRGGEVYMLVNQGGLPRWWWFHKV